MSFYQALAYPVAIVLTDLEILCQNDLGML